MFYKIPFGQTKATFIGAYSSFRIQSYMKRNPRQQILCIFTSFCCAFSIANFSCNIWSCSVMDLFLCWSMANCVWPSCCKYKSELILKLAITRYSYMHNVHCNLIRVEKMHNTLIPMIRSSSSQMEMPFIKIFHFPTSVFFGLHLPSKHTAAPTNAKQIFLLGP